MPENPKTAGSDMVDCRVQKGPCPGGMDDKHPLPCPCPECYYNGPDGAGKGYYTNIWKQEIPGPDRVAGKWVRMNDGHDSNHERQKVIRQAQAFMRAPFHDCRGFFFNTSIPRFDFPGPVIFTCNGRQPIFLDQVPDNLMAVRIRFNLWEWSPTWDLAHHYSTRGIPVLLTGMRYREAEAIPPLVRDNFYEFRQHIINPYWCARPEAEKDRWDVLRRNLAAESDVPVILCAGLCKDCRAPRLDKDHSACVALWKRCDSRMAEARKPATCEEMLE